ncbi:MAG: AAA family ATPase, partial [Thermocladium sp.]
MAYSSSNDWIELRVMEAKQKDAGKPIVRIDPIIMNEHDIEPGMVVEIRGKKVTAAKVWYGLPEDEDKGIIRMNSIMRKNADVSVGDTVKVRRVDPKPAQLVKLAPVSMALSIDQNFEQYIKQKLKDYILMEGDLIQVTVLGQPLTFQAVQVKPSNVATIIDDETQLKLLEKPVENIRVPRITWEDIGDLEEAKQKIRELVELPLRHPELFKYLGIDPPKG